MVDVSFSVVCFSPNIVGDSALSGDGSTQASFISQLYYLQGERAWRRPGEVPRLPHTLLWASLDHEGSCGQGMESTCLALRGHVVRSCHLSPG